MGVLYRLVCSDYLINATVDTSLVSRLHEIYSAPDLRFQTLVSDFHPAKFQPSHAVIFNEKVDTKADAPVNQYAIVHRTRVSVVPEVGIAVGADEHTKRLGNIHAKAPHVN